MQATTEEAPAERLLIEETMKPLKFWFRAIFEIPTRKTGISAVDFDRLIGFGSQKTGWTWLHTVRRVAGRSGSEPEPPDIGG